MTATVTAIKFLVRAKYGAIPEGAGHACGCAPELLRGRRA